MTKSKTSKAWLKEHFDDAYVKKSQQLGYRSRASFKLLEIQQKDKIFKPAMLVVDLGAAPGGWSQVAAELVGERGKVFSSDILPMDPISGVTIIVGDFTEENVFHQFLDALEGARVDLVLSDMAPNMSGIIEIDQPQVMYLAELALDLARRILKKDGVFLVKTFQGSGFEEFKRELTSCFREVKVRKPQASRARSRELYLLATGFIEAE